METVENAPESRASEAKKKIKDSSVIAGAILIGSLIIAGALLGNTAKPSVTPATKDQAAQANPTADKAASVTQDQVKALFTDKNIVLGNKDSKVLFVEFSDPSCPFCSVASGKNPKLNKSAGAQFTLVVDGGTYVAPVPEMKKLVDAGQAAFVWLYANGHGSGEMGTRALYCANEKGKFWEVHDLLMGEAGYALMNSDVKNDKTKSGTLANFLKSAVNANDMKACLDSGKYDNRIADDMAVAQEFGFSGTPSFFVNTDHFAGAYSFKDMQATIDKYLK